MHRFARHAGLVLGLLGVVLMGRGLYDLFAGQVYQLWHGRQLDRLLRDAPKRPRTLPSHYNPFQPGSLIGRLEIPRIGLSTIALEGDDTSELRLGAGRIRESRLPGETGNVVFAGHRDTVFRPLRQIRDGDHVDLQTANGTYHYVVEWSKVVHIDDIAVLGPTPQPSLTLVTCYPFDYIGSAPERFVVRARLDENLPVSPSPVVSQNSTGATQNPPPRPRAHVTQSTRAARVRPVLLPVITSSEPPEAEPLRLATPVAAVQADNPPIQASAAPVPATMTAAPPVRHGLARLNPGGFFRKLARVIKPPKKVEAAASPDSKDR